MASFNYITVEGDRLDALAAKYYGGNDGIKIILDANPDVPITAVYPLGTVLILPIISKSSIRNENDLPPWKK